MKKLVVLLRRSDEVIAVLAQQVVGFVCKDSLKRYIEGSLVSSDRVTDHHYMGSRCFMNTI